MERQAAIRSDTLVLFINGKKNVIEHADPEMTLLFYLRHKLSLTGTKLGCGEGGCGVCTVMVSKMDRQEKKIIHFAINACLAPLCAMHGLAITTVEGIGSSKTKLHPIQERLAAAHGSQCGFCTPGFVMSMYALLRSNPQPTRHQLDEAFQGNLCRCTGYRPIIDGLKTFTKEFQCGMGDQCCRAKTKTADQNDQINDPSDRLNDKDGNVVAHGELANGNASNIHLSNGDKGSHQTSGKLVKNQATSYDPSQEPIFPSELQLSDEFDGERKVFIGPTVTWYRPVNLQDLLDILHQHPYAKLINGNTEIGIEMKIKQQEYPVLVCMTHIPELTEVHRKKEGLYIGASCTLSQIDTVLKEAVNELPETRTRIFTAIIDMLKWFAGPQIRNVAAIGGNIMTASPISDLNPLLMAAGAMLDITSKGESRMETMDDTFFPSYRKTSLRPGEVLRGVLIPYTQEDEYFKGFKQARRREDDIAIVNAGMKATIENGSNIIKSLVISFGGMAATTVLAKKTMRELTGRRWDESLVDTACQLLDSDLPLPLGAPGGMEAFRKSLTSSFFFKFYLEVKEELNKKWPEAMSESVHESDISATYDPAIKPCSGSQIFEMTSENSPHLIGKPLPHLSGIKHTTGEAIYLDDMPHYQDELFMALVFSTKAHALILSVDPSVALSIPGVVSYIDHSDVPGKNETGCIEKDEEIFATKKVTCQGQVIGAIIAESALLARKAAHKVKVTYEEMKPIISIESAIEHNSFYDDHHESLISGDVTKTLLDSTHVLSGAMRMGGQEHFYLETHACLAVPQGEDRDIEIFSSCQSPSEAQILVASALGIGAHRVTVRVKRLGGGFGGKQSRFLVALLPAAVAAVKLRRPIRCMLDRDQDMVMTGTRHPYLGKYKVGFTPEGKIQGLDLELYSNAGNSKDLSWPVLEKALLQADNCYRLPSARIAGHLCKTNIPSCTAFRGFGGPQGMFMIESIIQQIAEYLDLESHAVRELNLYNESDHTPYRMPIENANIRKCWTDVIEQSDYIRRRKLAEQFNRENKWRKRGISVIPTKFGVGFAEVFFNQAVVLVNIYNDGTVLVAHSCTEMGQGIHTKMLQVASQVLDIPLTKVFINETSTAITPNMSPSAASVGSDLNGMAVMIACQKLADRLAPYKKKSPNDTWEKWVETAYLDRVNLSATGFFKSPDVSGYNWRSTEKDGPSSPYAYFTSGAAVTEVEIDCLTGDHVVMRTDIVMDIGQSMNPAIDIGQIEGGFVQGYGLFTLEEQRFSPDGFLFTRGPGTYKIPGLGDIPQEFNVTLLKGSHNPKAVYSSRAIGEPPLFLGASAFFAIKEAIFAARKSSGLSGHFQLNSPATAERIRMACVNQFTKQFETPEPGSYIPWAVDL